MSQAPSIGRIVHVNISSDPERPVLRPAIITAVWSNICVNVRLFADGGNDDSLILRLGVGSERPEWLTSIVRADSPTVGFREWCWPPYTPPTK